jgi:hypothetical protein
MNLDVNEVRKALNNKVSERQIQRLASRLQNFGTVSPAPLYMQGRPRAITPEAQEGYDKQATLKKYASFRGGIRYKGV